MYYGGRNYYDRSGLKCPWYITINISSPYHVAKCNCLIYDSSCVKNLPTFYRNICSVPPGFRQLACGSASMPLSSDLQWDVLVEHSGGSFLLSSSAVFPPSPSHVWWEQWKWGLHVSLSFLHWLDAQTGVKCCLAPCQGTLQLLNNFFYISKNDDFSEYAHVHSIY